jgi:DNA-binding Xre family transcriptional regulator
VTLQRALEWSVNASAIDRARILRAWTRRDLAQQSHVDEGTLCDLFAGRRRPMFGTLRAICHALELSLTDVIEFSAAGPKRVDLGANAADGSRAALL